MKNGAVSRMVKAALDGTGIACLSDAYVKFHIDGVRLKRVLGRVDKFRCRPLMAAISHVQPEAVVPDTTTLRTLERPDRR